MSFAAVLLLLAAYGISLLPLVVYKDPNRSKLLASHDRTLLIILSADLILPILLDFVLPANDPLGWIVAIAWLILGLPFLVIFGVVGFGLEIADRMRKNQNVLTALWSVSFLSLVCMAAVIFLVLSFPVVFH